MTEFRAHWGWLVVVWLVAIAIGVLIRRGGL